MKTTACECEHPGWCERHQMRKTAHWIHLCQTNERYFARWEQGRGPGQNLQQRLAERKPAAKLPGWGDRLETTLAKMGITEERYVAVKAQFGLPPRCDCAARKAWLNKVEQWVKGAFTPLPLKGNVSSRDVSASDDPHHEVI